MSRALAVLACVTACGRSGIEAFDDSSRDGEAARSGSGGGPVTGGTSAGARSSGGSGNGGRAGTAGAPGGTSWLGGAGSGGAGSGGLGGQAGEPQCPIEPGADRESPWSFQFGDEELQQGMSIVAAPDGSSYVAGVFEGTLELGSGTWQSETGGDAFIARFDPAGRILFAHRFPGFETRVRAMALTSEGILVVSGAFSGTVDFAGARLESNNGQNAFLLHLDACGIVIYAHSFGGDASSIDAITPIGDGYALAGYFVGGIDVGGGSWENPAFEPDGFVARYDRGAGFVWGRHLSGARRIALTADDEKNLYIAGQVRTVLDLGTAGSLAGPGRAFAAKLDAKGTPRWGVVDQGERTDGGAQSSSHAITIDPAGHIIVLVDVIYAPLDFGEGARGDWVCCGNDEFALSLHPDGVPLWLTLIDNYVSIKLAPTSTGFAAVTNTAGAQGLDVTRFDVNGVRVGARGFGFASYVNVYGVAIDDRDSMLVTGSFRGQVDFGSGPLEPTEGFDWDGYVTRLPANALE